jgi:hypothetical protein
MKWRTCVKASWKQYLLIRATLLGGAGMLILVMASILLPVNQLSYWGFPLFIFSIGLVAGGMIPYRRLVQQERNPDEIILTKDDKLVYHRQGKKVGLIPLSMVDKIVYIDSQKNEGISLLIHRQLMGSERIIIYQKQQLQFLNGNIFLPHFSERTFKELINIVEN